MMNISPVTNNKVSFGVKINDDGYSKNYNQYGQNGTAPDEHILRRLKYHYPFSKGVDVLDIGAGDGRNSIAIAEMGYNVTANEICPEGRQLITQEAKAKDLDNITVSKEDILSHLTSNLQKFHFALMSHVSQHLSPSELSQALSNIHKKLKSEGVLIFDALIRTREGKDYKSTEHHETSGCAHYNQAEIENTAKSNGFDILEISDFREKTDNQAGYLNSGLWGRAKDPELNKPVKLKWVVLQKHDK